MIFGIGKSKSEKNCFPHTPSESGTFPPSGLDEGATFR